MESSNASATHAVSAPNEESNSNSSSLTLSITPPLSEPPKDESSTISEHLSSIENDRSMQEIEVINSPENFNLLLQNLPSEEERISQELKPPSLNSSSFNNSNSIISLNGLEKFISTNMEGRNSARSILEEILNNDLFKSDTESREESLDIFANVDLDDKLLNSYNLGKSTNFNITDVKNDSINSYDEVCKRIKDFEELITIKDTTIAALTSELDSFRELMSNNSSFSLGTSTTDYKQYQDECHNKLVEYHNAMTHKDEQIEKLTASLQQSILNREEMKQHFKNEIGQLQEQLEKTSNLLKDHKGGQNFDFDNVCSRLESVLNPSQISLFNELKMALDNQIQSKVDEKRRGFENEISNLKTKIDADKAEYEKELSRLRNLVSNQGSKEALELRQELDAKHSKEMEELRTYFEKKCADLEKNYSEEIFSQQSRKMSGSSTCSDIELSSDFIFNPPGPGGDTKIDYGKKDIIKMHQTLTQLIDLISKYDLNQLTDDEFNHLKEEIQKFDLRNLIKYDLATMKNELQNKYHAELEILREDFDNRVDILNVENENKLRSLEKRYLEEIEDLNGQLRGRISTTVQEVANSGEFEIDEVVQSYERRLQEQVTLAKIDIIAALEKQIQRLVASENVDEDWPEELLQLKRRFAEKYQEEIAQLKHEHDEEIARLKEEHVKMLNGALERARRRSLRDADSLSKGEIELLKERDSLKKQTLSLRNLLGELLKYFTQCEDELNNTLVEELVSKNFTQIEAELNSPRDSVKRVHITPNFNDLINLIDNNSAEDDFESIDLKSELGTCLEKLKSDANAILALTSNFNKNDEKIVNSKPRRESLEKELSLMTRKLISETQAKNELSEQLSEAKSIVQSLESDRGTLENQLEQVLERQKILENELLKAKDKIAELIENGHKEIISEGYGEDGQKSVKGMADAVATLMELQEKSRNLIENPGNLDQNLMHLIEDLCRVGEKIVEEARRDRDDLKQQIDAADKKYKITCQFLEDQAAEREQERDEAQKEIDTLKEHLRDREKDRASCERIINEVENLEQQLRDMSKLMDATEKRCKEAENERQEAVDKIYELRDIIRDLEDQVKVKTNTEDELRNIVNELELIVKQQVGSDEELNRNVRDVSDIEQLHNYIGNLEGELQKLRLSTEIAGSEGALEQIKNLLCDFESTLDKRTKDLEGLHSAVSTSCSSPSEDMSIRDVVNQTTIYEECEVPLQQLARLKEKLVRHSRAEDAAVKRIRDLEMQITGLKRDLEESQAERDILKKQISDHLVLISNLQIRLDEQRIRAEHIEKQTNTSLEVQNYDLKNAIVLLEEKVAKRDKTIAQLKFNVEETKKRLEDREKEISSIKEDEMIAQMQEQLEFLRSENHKLKSKMNKDAQILPNLVENIISDKNNDIEILREKLSETEKQLDLLNSLNLDKSQIEALSKLKLSGVSFQDLVDLDNEQIRRAHCDDTLSISQNLSFKKGEETIYSGVECEVSSIEKVGPPNLFHSLQTPVPKANSTEKHVRFEDEVQIDKLQTEIGMKNRIIEDYANRLRLLEQLEVKVGQLQDALEQTEDNLKKATEAFEEEQRKNEEAIKEVQSELTAKRNELEAKESELVACRNQIDEDKKQLKAKEDDLKNAQKIKTELTNSLKIKDGELQSHEDALKILNEELRTHQDDVANLKKLHAQNVEEIKRRDEQIAHLKIQTDDLTKELNHVQHLVAEKEKIIDQMGIDSRSLHINLETIQNKLQESGNVVDLGRRLREEQKKNSVLYEELHGLKAQLLSIDKQSLDDITGQVQKELDYSSYLDTTLINAVSDSSLENHDVEALKLALRKQKSVNKQLIKAKEHAETKSAEMYQKYEVLKAEMEEMQMEDAKMIKQLRNKLDNALDNELEFDRMLEAEKHDRNELEGELKTMKEKISTMHLRSQSLDEDIVKREKKMLRKVIATLEDENFHLKKDVEEFNKIKADYETNLKRERDRITSYIEEIAKLESKLSEQSYNEEKLANMKAELEIKTNELTITKASMEEMKQDRNAMMEQIRTRHRRVENETIPDKLMEKIRELNEAVKDNVKMVDLITRLTHEKSVLEERIIVLEEENRGNVNLPFDDPVSRANYLFAKYLRAESYRKALVWQKRYLISLLETYQSCQNVTEFVSQRVKPIRKRYRFRHVALMVVSVCRMKYLVKRWHSGKRIAQQRVRVQSQKAQFQVGQPVSNQNFFPKVTKSALNSSTKSDMPWCGTSPPCKEPQPPKRIESLPKNLVMSERKQIRESLVSPGMLSKYIERFNSIQERLGLDPHH